MHSAGRAFCYGVTGRALCDGVAGRRRRRRSEQQEQWWRWGTRFKLGSRSCVMAAQIEAKSEESQEQQWQRLHLDQKMPPLLQPSIEELACILLKCRKERNLEQVLRLHAYMHQHGLDAHASLGNDLVSLLLEVVSMCHAQQVFDRLVPRSECSWNLLIVGYVKCGESRHALTLYQKMQEHDSLHPSGYAFVALLKACTALKDLEAGRELHAEIARQGLLERNIFIGSTLVDMYAKCGSLAKAQEVFDKLPVRDVVTWNALIAGYAEHGRGEEALYCFDEMQLAGISWNAVTLICSLKACGSIGSTVKGQEMHAEIARIGLERDPAIGNTLVDMYAKFGWLVTAQEVFDKLPFRDVVSWNALMAGYTEQGRGEEALYCLEQMQQESISLSTVTSVCVLKACSRKGATVKGREVHAEIAKKGLESKLLIGSTLVDMYSKCGLLATAQEVFNKLPVRDVVSWTALMSGYAEYGHGEVALDCLEQMQHECISLNAVTFVCTLKACGSIGATIKGQEIHGEIAKKGLERELLIGNTLVDMYAKCGLLETAQEVFDKLPVRDMVSWNALITGYVEHGHGDEALHCFEQMQHESTYLNATTFFCSLKACGSIGATAKGREMHAEIFRKGLEIELLVGNMLIDMYAKCGLLAEAQAVFDKLPVRDVVSWNTLIAGYVEHGCGDEALDCFEQMQHEGASPNAFTLVCILRACSSEGAPDKGRAVHGEIARKGLERELLIGNTLVDMYAKCGSFATAQEVFNKLPVRDVVSWTALLAGYAEHGRGEEALYCFKQMQRDGISFNAVTFVCSLKACGSIGATLKGQEIHAEVARKGLERDLVIGNTLVDMYAKCGWLATAQEVFDKLLIHDVVSWNALIAGYTERGRGEEALFCLEQLQHQGIQLNATTIVCSLKACGSTGATVKGQEMHIEIVRKGLERDLIVGNILIDMYAKCGLLAEAHEVFDKLPVRDLISWNAVIAGYAQLGESGKVFHIFESMIGECMKPNLVTFLSVLNACSHAGLVDKGQMYFEAISNDYGFNETLEHYTCMVDLLGRAGHIDKAVAMIRKMPLHPGIVAWHTVLGACRKWGNVELGRHAFEHAMWLDEKGTTAYICMFNIYADAAMQEVE